MLRIGDSARLGRRDFLRVGGLALGGLSLPWLMPAARAGTKLAEAGKPVTDKSVVFLFLHGGPSQFETFDPKMTAPAEIRSATGEIKTALPGVTFGTSLPEARRSWPTGSASSGRSSRATPTTTSSRSSARTRTARTSARAYASVAGGNNPSNGLPTNCVLFPRAVDPNAGPEQASFGKFAAHGPFAASTAPFQPDGGGTLKKDMRLNLPLDRLDDRRAMLDAFDAAKARLRHRASRASDAARQKAFSHAARRRRRGVRPREGRREDGRAVRHRDARCRRTKIDKKWNNYKHYADNAKHARQAAAAGPPAGRARCGFVTVTTNFVWDMHADVNNATMTEGMGYMGPPLDHAVSVFLDDLRDRGLEDKILLVACGEMGRTPRINKKGGRDHWGNLGPLLLAGGGLPRGAVIGQSTANGGEPATEPVRIPNLIGTIMHTLFDVGQAPRHPRRRAANCCRWRTTLPSPGCTGSHGSHSTGMGRASSSRRESGRRRTL